MRYSPLSLSMNHNNNISRIKLNDAHPIFYFILLFTLIISIISFVSAMFVFVYLDDIKNIKILMEKCNLTDN